MSTLRNRFDRRQAGGTLIGFIAGLVIGLGIAVVVAVMITKTPAPFLNAKGSKGGDVVKPPETAASANASAIGDPNKPLYGKQDAAREAAKEFAKEAPAAEAVAPAAPAAPVAAAQAKAPDAAVNKNAPAIVPAKAEAKEAPAAGEDKYVYYLQAGAFREQADAEGARAKLALQGFEANVSEKPSDNGAQGGKLYRVRLGPYAQVDAMNRVRSKLAESGMDVAVVRIAK
jgi:cell division protein FtsN